VSILLLSGGEQRFPRLALSLSTSISAPMLTAYERKFSTPSISSAAFSGVRVWPTLTLFAASARSAVRRPLNPLFSCPATYLM
jgi:hypothetical protein